MEKNLKSKIINPPASPCKALRAGHKSSRVLVGMSGGVDSSVAAALLKKQGYDVVGAFLLFTRMTMNECTNRHELENKCCDYKSLVTARSVANQLKIPFYVLDASKVFKKEVIDYFISEYDSGRTPNPCVVCNKKIKFGWMLEQAKKLGCQFIATGHYAQLCRELPITNFQFPNKSQISNLKSQTKLLQSKDKKKDQSYFLWQLSQEQLSHILFPLGDYTKEEVRRLAKKWKLPTASRRESQDLCFINTDKADFIANYADKLNKPGDIVDTNGKILGQHKGLCYYTVGQRQGIGVQLIANRVSHIANCKNDSSISLGTGKQLTISNKQTSSFQPAYVIRLDVEKNQLIVGSKEDLNSFELVAEKVNFLRNTCLDLIFESRRAKLTKYEKNRCQAKIRYGAPLSHCHIVYPELNRKVKLSNGQKDSVAIKQYNSITVKFDQPQRAITPGQSVVFYQGESLLGGGIIEKSF